MFGRGDGTFQSDITIADGVGSIELADLNGDGCLDLIGRDGGANTELKVLLGKGNGSFSSAMTYFMNDIFVTEFTVGDLNNDGYVDLISGGSNFVHGFNVSTRLGNGDGTFSALVSQSNLEESTGMEMIDINGDGNLDLLEGLTTGGSAILFGLGDGTFGSQLTIAYEGRNVAVGDTNSDGVQDFVLAGYGEILSYRTNTAFGINPLLPFSLVTRYGARQALTEFGKVSNRLSSQRGTIGAFQSRVGVAGNVLQASSENYAAAAGRIKDADIADESSRLVRTQILQQAASAALAQANQQPALALQLLS
jgi:flagellin-like hook-associated protein FlgL